MLNPIKLSLFLFFLTPLSLFCYSDLHIANALKNISMQKKIDKRILYTIAKIESNFKPYSVSFVSSKKRVDLDTQGIEQFYAPYGKRYIINLKGNPTNLKLAGLELIEKGYRVDFGLMQINSVNLTKSEIYKIFEPHYNISKATEILQKCIDKYTKIKRSIECYNKGSRVGNYDYYKKFQTNFTKDFGGI